MKFGLLVVLLMLPVFYSAEAEESVDHSSGSQAFRMCGLAHHA